jgi:hypothetical protein
MVCRQSDLTHSLSVVGATPGRRSYPAVDVGDEGRDDELLTVCGIFRAVDEELSRLVECYADPPEQEFWFLGGNCG